MGIKIVHEEAREVLARDLKAGEVVEGTIGHGYEGLFLRTFDGLVNLSRPSQTWSWYGTDDHKALSGPADVAPYGGPTIKGVRVDVELRVRR